MPGEQPVQLHATGRDGVSVIAANGAFVPMPLSLHLAAIAEASRERGTGTGSDQNSDAAVLSFLQQQQSPGRNVVS